MKKKRIWAGLTVLAAILLAACAQKDLPPTPEDGVLIYAALNPTTEDLTKSIARFNGSHEDVQIEVRDYSDKEGRKRLLAEISAGLIPDIMDMNSSIPYQRLAKGGYLENLWPYIESDPVLGRDQLLEAPLKAAEVNGKLYIAFDSVVVYTMVGAERVVGNRTSWSLNDLQKAFSSMPENSTITEYTCDKYDMLQNMLPGCLDDYVDWETGQCFFDSDNFRKILEFLDSFPLVGDTMKSEEDFIRINDEVYWKRQNGQQMLTNACIHELGAINFYDGYFGESACFVGYPVEDGSVGSYFSIRGNTLAMSSTCRNKEAAWDFIKQVFQPKGITNDTLPEVIPINQHTFSKSIQISLNRGPYGVFQLYGPPEELRPLTSNDVQRYKEYINSIDKIDLFDSAIYYIVEESCGPYFAGDKSLDETAQLIQNRVTLYVNEQK